MSTIFGHGRLRLYLLKLLDESPKHGYEIIRLLRDRFLGVYSPSPGTIYPRLARLEEEGLVTHEEINGRKVYRLTDKGRAELHNRTGDLDDLERELADSVRDVALAVQRDVRDTISHLREELKFAARGSRRGTKAKRKAEETAAKGADAGDVWGTVSAEDSQVRDRAGGSEQSRDREHQRGAWWERDWEKFGHGFGWGPWGRGTPKKEDERTDFDRALHDFTDRVRSVVQEAGQVGEAAVGDLRRILDETIEIIRRDATRWGPAEEATGEKPSSAKSEDEEDKAGEEQAPAPGPAAEEGRRTFAQPPAGAGQDTSTAQASESPTTRPAAQEEKEKKKEERDGPGN